VKRVKGLLADVFPLVELTEVLIAIDGATGFSERLLHAANSRSPAMLVHLYAAILALWVPEVCLACELQRWTRTSRWAS
jgi:hypothetical protein